MTCRVHRVTASRRRSRALSLGVMSLLGLTVLGCGTESTDASWSGGQHAQAELFYPEGSGGGNGEEIIEEIINGDGELTPEIIEENLEDILEQIDEEDLEELINDIEAPPEVIEEISEVPIEDDHLPDGVEVENDNPPEAPGSAGRSLDFCYDFTIVNSNGEEYWWEMVFDTSQSPFWGWEPAADGGNYHHGHDGNYGRWETAGWDPPFWTIRGLPSEFDGWRQPSAAPIPPDEQAEVTLCVQGVPLDNVSDNFALFTYEVTPRPVGEGDLQLSLSVSAHTQVETYIPWSAYVALGNYVCRDQFDVLEVSLDGWAWDHAASGLVPGTNGLWHVVPDQTNEWGYGLISASDPVVDQSMLHISTTDGSEVRRVGTHC